MHEKLENLIDRIRENIHAGVYRNEQSVRETIVVPVLHHLDWDDLNPSVVVREYNLAGRRVDYALAPPDGKPIVLIEVKGLGQIEGADRQLFEYAFHEGVPFAVLTDGQQWHFFLPGEQGNYAERRVYLLDLVERDSVHGAQILYRYLSFNRVRSGDALDDARKDYRNAARQKEAEHALPKAWSELVTERDEILLDLIAERVESLCGIRPDAEQVEEFIARNLVAGPSTSPDNVESPKPPTHQRKSRTASKITYELYGHRYNAKTAKEALLDILRRLADSNPGLFEKLAPRVSGRKRNHIASDKRDVYPQRPDLAETATEIAPGWWIGLNIANREKRRILEHACSVVGIRYGHELKIDLPNS